MTEAKSMKLKEYGTEIIAHDSSNTNRDTSKIRVNNTFKSSVLDQTPEAQNKQHDKSRERLFANRPLTAHVQRTSYQDSNIFGYKENQDITVQQSANKNNELRQRNNPTYQSRIFAPASGESDETQRPPSKSRQEDKWRSSIFDGPSDDNGSRRRKLGGFGAGTETLFGKDQIDYDNRSNAMSMIGGKKPQIKKWVPVRQEKTAEQRKNEELYGQSAKKFGVGQKKDGTLMSQGTDWKNLQQTHSNSPLKQGKNDIENQANGTRDKKYQNLQSNILSNQDQNGERASYNPDADKVAATWNNQGSGQKCVNKGSTKVDTFKKRQAQLNSQVFDLPEYADQVPMKKKKLDINNLNDQKRKRDHLYSDILGTAGNGGKLTEQQRNPDQKTQRDLQASGSDWSTPNVKEQIKKDYSGYKANDKKMDQLRSAFDNHNYQGGEGRSTSQFATPQKPHINLNCRHSRATKIRDLSSDIMGLGDSLQKHVDADNTKNTVIDLDIKGLPGHAQADDLKKIANVKHVIQAQIDHDSITNQCLGTGRVKLRLGPNEDIDTVKLQYLKAGFGVKDHEENPKKKTNFTQDQSLITKSPQKQETDAKMTKINNLQSNSPEMFGNTSKFQSKFELDVKQGDLHKDKQDKMTESLAISNWNRVKK